jgi:hypothetical protein
MLQTVLGNFLMLGAIDLSTGESLMRWSVRIAVACVYLRFWIRLRTGATSSGTPSGIEFWLWTIGLLMYLCHVALAFQFVHRWNHNEAWQYTAEETAELTGVFRGDGIWANYAFTLIWTLDAGRLALAYCRRRPTSRRLDRMSFIVFLFMIFNATVVFGPALYRWLAIPAFLALLIAWRFERLGAESELPQAADQ